MDKNSKNNKSNQKIFAIDGGKNAETVDTAKLIVDGEEIHLSNLILAGEDPDGKRVIFSWNVTIDEFCSHHKVLDVLLQEKVKKLMNY